MYTTPIYQSSTTLKVQPSSGSSIGDIFGAGLQTSRPQIATEIELIKSRRNLEEVIIRLNLLEEYKAGTENPDLININSVINSLNNMISVSSVRDTNIVRISVESINPKLAENIANELADVYNEFLKSLSQNEFTVRREFIQSQIPVLERELAIAQDELKKFKEKNNLFVLETEAKTLLEFITFYDQQINSKELQKAEIEASIKVLNNLFENESYKIVSNSQAISSNQIIQQLRTKLVNLQVEYAGLSSTMTSTDPKLINIRQQILQTESLIKEEVELQVFSGIESLNPNYTNLYMELINEQTKLEIIKSSIESTQKLAQVYQIRLRELPALEQIMIDIQRNIKVKESLYILMLEKLEEIKIAEAGVLGTANVIDRAYTPNSPIKPNKKLTMAIGGVLGIFLGILLIFLIEMLDKKVKDEEEIKRITKGTPIIGRIPHLEIEKIYEKPELVVLNKPTSPGAESYKLLSTNINYINGTEEASCISVTSSGPGEGKTITSTNLAISYAQNGLKTLLIDADMRKPRLEKILMIERAKLGVVNHLIKDVPLEKIILTEQGGIENFDVLPVGVIPPNPTALLTSNKFKGMILNLKEKYDKIIIDLPPMQAAAIVSKYTDGLLLVIRADKTHKTGLKLVIDNFVTSGTNLLGTVINDISEKTSNYYYYYYYYYQDTDKKGKRRKKKENKRN
jgi:capsular exopolysaccharide synthesis family protein